MTIEFAAQAKISVPMKILLLLFPYLVIASSGDRDSLFINCIQKCKCKPNSGLFSWSCLDNCKYECMWQITDMYRRHNQPTHQYYGKWYC